VDVESSFVEQTNHQSDPDPQMTAWCQQTLPVVNSIEATAIALAPAVRTKDVDRILDVVLPFRSYLNEVEPTLPSPPDAHVAIHWDRVLTLQHRLIEETIRSSTSTRDLEPAVDLASELAAELDAFTAALNRRHEAGDHVGYRSTHTQEPEREPKTVKLYGPNGEILRSVEVERTDD